MPNYQLYKIEYSNYKYVSPEKGVSLPLTTAGASRNLVILDGPNGYGKTTLFEAIELLLTGEIKSFKGDLKSRGTEGYEQLIKDKKQPMLLRAEFLERDGSTLCVARRWDFSVSPMKCSITINDVPSTQEDLELTLQFTKSLFDLGMYLSQKESLSFLQNKYKSRGEKVASILDTSFIQEKTESMEKIKKLLEEYRDTRQQELQKEIDKSSTLQKQLKGQIDLVQGDESQPAYEPLFPTETYAFDMRELNVSQPYERTIAPLENLKAFVENYEGYQAHCTNAAIEDLLHWDKRGYLVLFYKKIIEELKSNEQLLSDLEMMQQLSAKFHERQYPLAFSEYQKLGAEENDVKALEALTYQVQILKKKLGERGTALQKIIESRTRFVEIYEGQQQSADLNPSVCPICGAKWDDLSDVMQKAGVELKKSCSELQREIADRQKAQGKIAQRIDVYFQEQIERYADLLYKKAFFANIRDLETTELEKRLKSVGVSEFSSNEETPNQQAFDKTYHELMNFLQEKRKPETVVFLREELLTYQQIHNQYYKGKVPYHTKEQLEKKRYYIAYQYTQKKRGEYQKVTQELKELEEKKEYLAKRYSEKIDAIKTVFDKYKKAQTEYNKAIQKALCLPIYIFSGRIIQNYPLGLGIYAEIDAKNVVLKPEHKEDDVYNVLSAGQLNGLALAVLLSVHAVYGKSSNLDLLMIDDPLQTIDELSAMSLTDLLMEQLCTGQLLLSTHEPQEANMFRYKFEQGGYAVKDLNMQRVYLEDVVL